MLSWNKIIETLIPLLILCVISGIAKIIYDYRSSLSLWFRRLKLNLLPVKFNVALSLDFKDGLNSGIYYQETKNNLLKIIDQNGLSGLVILKDFSDIKKFSSKNEAESFRNKKQLDLIIWGGFSGDGLKKGGEEIYKIDLNFTYGYPDDKEKKIGAMLLVDIGSKFAVKNYWQILENNSSVDLEIITNNLFDLSAYILGTTLKLSGRIAVSLKIFESLFNKLLVQNDRFSQQIIPHILNCYEVFIVDIGVNRKRSDLGVEFCRKYLKLKQNNFFALSNLAIFQYRLGLEKEAEKNVEKLLKLYPNQPVTEVDIAFFRILQKNYTNAYKHYQKLSTYQQIDFNAQEVVEFLFSQYELKKDSGLLYGAGIISFYFGDQSLAKETFLQYLSVASERNCKQMYRNAKRLSK